MSNTSPAAAPALWNCNKDPMSQVSNCAGSVGLERLRPHFMMVCSNLSLQLLTGLASTVGLTITPQEWQQGPMTHQCNQSRQICSEAQG